MTSGRITFSTSLPALASPVPYAVLAVCDNGPGMDAATAARIWEPGWSTKDHGSGLRGYGLASVQAFVAEAGGRWKSTASRATGPRSRSSCRRRGDFHRHCLRNGAADVYGARVYPSLIAARVRSTRSSQPFR